MHKEHRACPDSLGANLITHALRRSLPKLGHWDGIHFPNWFDDDPPARRSNGGQMYRRVPPQGDQRAKQIIAFHSMVEYLPPYQQAATHVMRPTGAARGSPRTYTAQELGVGGVANGEQLDDAHA